MNNFGIRYKLPEIRGWIPKVVPLEVYLQTDKDKGRYGKGDHQFVPKEYIGGK